jgi:hypothetical protein
MNTYEQLLTETIEQTIAIYCSTRPRTEDEMAAALRELRCYLPIMITQNVTDRIRLAGKALRHLRELEYRPRSGISFKT